MGKQAKAKVSMVKVGSLKAAAHLVQMPVTGR
jgi:hypothetical protein